MTSATRTIRRAAVAMACMLGVLAPMGAAQNQNITVNDLRRENDALRQKIDQMASQLDQSTQKVDELETRIRQLTAQVEALRTELANQGIKPRGTSGQPIVVDEPSFAKVSADDPYSSPEALLLTLQQDYERTATEQRWAAMSDQRQMRMISDWARGASRRFRSRITWHLDVNAVRDVQNGVVVIGNVIEPASGLPYGSQEVTLELTGSLARKVLETPETEVWRISGAVAAAPRMNAERTEQGFFNVPAFIGPYAEFVLTTRVNSLTPVSDEMASEDGSQR